MDPVHQCTNRDTTDTICLVTIAMLSMNSAAYMLTILYQREPKKRILMRFVGVVGVGNLFWSFSKILYTVIMEIFGCFSELCVIVQISIHFWPMVTSLFITFMTIYILYALFAIASPNKSDLLFWTAIIFIFSISITLAILVVMWKPITYQDGWCNLDPVARVYFWFLPFGVCFFVSALLLVLIMGKSCSHRIQNKKIRIPVKFSLFTFTFLVSWFSFMVQQISFITDLDTIYWFSIFTTITLNSQGLLHLVSYYLNSNKGGHYSWFVSFLLWLGAPLWLLLTSFGSFEKWMRSKLINSKRMSSYSNTEGDPPPAINKPPDNVDGCCGCCSGDAQFENLIIVQKN